MARKSRRRPLKKRNLAAKNARARASGPMRDKRRKSRQEQRVEDERKLREQGG